MLWAVFKCLIIFEVEPVGSLNAICLEQIRHLTVPLPVSEK